MTTDRTEHDRQRLTAYVRISKPHQTRCIPLPGDVSGASRGVSRLPLTPRATCQSSKISFTTTIKGDLMLHEWKLLVFFPGLHTLVMGAIRARGELRPVLLVLLLPPVRIELVH